MAADNKLDLINKKEKINRNLASVNFTTITHTICLTKKVQLSVIKAKTLNIFY